MTRWRPRRDWFADHCPALSGIAGRADALPDLDEVWRRNRSADGDQRVADARDHATRP